MKRIKAPDYITIGDEKIKMSDEAKDIWESIHNLNLNDKQTIVDLLTHVQAGNISCRAAATGIRNQHVRSTACKCNKDLNKNTDTFYNGL